MASYFIKKDTLPTGDVRYRARIKHQSRFIKSKTFKRKRDAAEWAAGFVSNLENFRNHGQQPCDVTFDRLLKEYIRDWRGTDASRSYSLVRFGKFFGDKNIAQITTEDCRNALKMWEKKKSATHNKNRAILCSVFDFAIRRNEWSSETYIDTNPAKGVRNKPLDNLRVRYLSDDEKRRLVDACREIGGRFYLAFLLALSTGLRKSNVLNLRWSDVDFDRRLLTVRRTKNGDPITAPVPAAVLDILKKDRQVGNNFVFASNIDHRVPSQFKKEWLRARQMAGIKDFRWHDLRHDVASTMAREGRTMIEIAHVLGHRSLQSTSRYTHLSTDHKADALNSSVGKVLEGVL